MTSRSRKIGAFATFAATALMLGTSLAHASPLAADTDDKYNPGGKLVTGKNSTSLTFVAGAITVTCTFSTAGGTTPKTGLAPFTMKPLPVFADTGNKPCTDNIGGMDTTKTVGAWKIGFVDAPNDESQKEPNTGDKLEIIIPKAGAVVSNSFGCTITISPNGTTTVKGTYDDKSKFTLSKVTIPIKIVGGGICPTNTTATFSGTYIFTPGFGDGS